MAEASRERWDPIGYQQLTGLAAATALTVPPTARRCLIQGEAQIIRWRDDGTNPTASAGMILPINVVFEYEGDLESLRFIEALVGGRLNVSYYA